MGGSSVPSSTYQVQNLVSGPWAVPELKKMMLKVLKPTMGYLGDEQSMMIGVNKGDPNALRKFYGLSSDAPVSDITSAIQQHGVTQAPSTYKGPVPLSYANGGLLSFYDKPRGYATGATVTALTPAQQQIVQNISKAIADGTVTQAQIDKLNKIEANTGKDVSPYVSTGTSPVTNKVTAAAISNATAAYNASPAGQQATSDQAAINTAMQNAGMTPSDAIQGQAGFQGLGAYDPVTHTWQVTNPAFQQVQSNLNQMQTAPSQYGQATNLYNQAASGLGGLTNYQPQQVSAQQISAPTASALTASAQGYGASSMQAPEAAQAKDYEAALMQGPGSWTDRKSTRLNSSHT